MRDSSDEEESDSGDEIDQNVVENQLPRIDNLSFTFTLARAKGISITWS